MNLLFLRGQVPRDRNPDEIMYTSIYNETDMWTHLAYEMTGPDDMCTMLYWGGNRRVYYGKNFCIQFIPDLKKYRCSFIPDTIIARGGFSEYNKTLKQFPGALKIYYGAGKRYIPKKGKLYDIILVDSNKQREQVYKKYPEIHIETFFKAAPDNLFYPRDVKKLYDICFVAANPADKRKRVQWVYKTCPKNYNVLQIGKHPKFPVPKNVVVKRVIKEKVPKLISQCKVGIVPYSSDDSGPRVIPEMMACDVVPIIMNTCQVNHMYPTFKKEDFWSAVKHRLNSKTVGVSPFDTYISGFTMKHAAKELREKIENVRRII